MVAEQEAVGRAAANVDPGDDEALDAYSTAVSTAAARLIPSVASLRVRAGSGWGGGAGSAVAFTPDGYLLVFGLGPMMRSSELKSMARSVRSVPATR